MADRPVHHPRAYRLAMPAAMIAALAGCTVGPNFQPPKTPMPDSWIDAKAAVATPPAQPGTSTAVSDAADLERWWAQFNDPILDSLIERGAAGNLNVRRAEARIRQARAGRIIAGSANLPTVDASASATRSRAGSSGA